MPLRVGVIGAGMIGQEHARRLSGVVTGAEVVAVTDLAADRAEAIAAETGARVYDSGSEVIASAEVDAVLVTSWGPTHAEHVLNAIAAGKPVFCEKPLATDAADCRRIMSAEAEHGKRLVQVGFMRRYDDAYRQLKQLVDAGRIGTPLMVHCAHRNPGVPDSYTSEMAMLDTAVHEVDVLRWLLDEEIVSAQVLTPRPTRHRFDHLQDPQIMLFETSGGARIDVEVFVNCRYGYDIRCEIVGETGAARLADPARPAVRQDGRESTAVTADWRERFGAAFDAEFQAWVDAASEGTATGPSAWDGYAATAVGDAAVEALKTGGVVPVDMVSRPAFYTGEQR
ncbi:inositol 2-dehydrogenase [Actinomadura sp. NBRC 104425]|uniref:Gfo/Idh/MocA family oxidoreductase n=1 Tax=Actinomadura sp. NBRC 104425 TaxID=3032204 RepID=UPI0024A20EBD|nr:Gfo/Idh/MocA family oxidoreductase [Actinomadura sp. NBRC 104425]GLZ15420.1 inositol 2-dehydrogenase [Actinomadura sp. NBRC 104425]